MHKINLLSGIKPRLVTIVAISTLSIAGCTQSDAVQVCSVHDGDTLTTCAGQKVRLWGIDAPELKQTYGFPARNTLRGLVLNKPISLQCVGKSYKRQVCLVSVNGQNVNQKMVQLGAAFDYPQYSKGQYLSAQQQAQAEHKGVWQTDNGGARPWKYRRNQHGKRPTHRTFNF